MILFEKYSSNNKFSYIILFSIFFLLVYSINSSLSFNSDNIKHWSTYHKDDIVFVYNSLLYLEGMDQHHTDHPSLFTFIIFSLFYKIFYFIGYIDFANLTGFLESEDINLSLSKLFYISRLVIQLFSLGIIVIVYKISNCYSFRKLDSFFISLFFLMSSGFISASNRIESGLISVFFLLYAFFFFIKFLNYENKKNLIFLTFSFLLIFSGMMQKKIIYFAIPFLFLSSLIFLKSNPVIYRKYNFFDFQFIYKYLLIIMYLFVFIFIYFKTIDNNSILVSRDIDFIFLLVNYFGFNLLFFLYIRKFQRKYYENLLTYNLLFGLTYFLYKYFLIFFLSADISIWSISFTNFLGHLNMFVGNDNLRGAFDFNSFNLYFFKFISNLNLVIIKYFLSFNYQSILVWVNILLFIIYLKKNSTLKKISIFFLFFGFLIVQSIILFRYEQDTYYLNSEFFLLFSLSLLLNNFLNKKFHILFCIMLGLILFSSNIENLKSLKKENLKSYCSLFKNFKSVDGFYEFYTNKIPRKIRKSFCSDLNV